MTAISQERVTFLTGQKPKRPEKGLISLSRKSGLDAEKRSFNKKKINTELREKSQGYLAENECSTNWSDYKSAGHFRVHVRLLFKESLSAKFFL